MRKKQFTPYERLNLLEPLTLCNLHSVNSFNKFGYQRGGVELAGCLPPGVLKVGLAWDIRGAEWS